MTDQQTKKTVEQKLQELHQSGELETEYHAAQKAAAQRLDELKKSQQLDPQTLRLQVTI